MLKVQFRILAPEFPRKSLRQSDLARPAALKPVPFEPGSFSPARQPARSLRRWWPLRPVLLLAVGLASFVVSAGPPTAAVSLPADPTALVTPGTSEAELIQRLGRAQVRRANIATGEGETKPGTLLFPDAPTRRLELLWHDPDRRTAPAVVIIRARESAWLVLPGIGIGTDLKTVEGLNGRSFELAGFDWDYQGSVTSWNRGRFDDDRNAGTSLTVRLRPMDAAAARYAQLSAEEQRAVSGDRKFASDDDRMQRIDPLIYEIALRFPEEFHGASRQEIAKAPPWPAPYAGDVYQCRIVLGREDWRWLIAGERNEIDQLDAEFLDLNGDGLCEAIVQHSCGSDGCDGAVYTPRDGRLKEIGRANGYAFVVLLERANGWLQLGEWFPREEETWRYLSRYDGEAYRVVQEDRFDWNQQLGGKRYAATRRPLPQRLTAAAGVRLRVAPEPAAAVVATLPIGTPLTLTGEGTPPVRSGEFDGPWYPVRSGEAVTGAAQIAAGQGVSGWVFGPLTLPLDPETPDAAYRTLLEGRLAASAPRALADDLELLGFIARHLTADGPNDAVRAGAGPVVERIDSDLKRACRFDPGQSAIDFRAFRSEIATLLRSWKGRDQTGAEPGHPEQVLHRIGALLEDCAALSLRTRFEQEALGGLAVGITGREVESLSRCRFRRYPPELSEVGDTFVRWQSTDCGLDLTIVVGEDKDALSGAVTDIALTRGFTGRGRDGIGIGSTRAEVLAAFGRYLTDDALAASGSGNWVCGEGATVSFELEHDRVSAIDLRWGFCD